MLGGKGGGGEGLRVLEGGRKVAGVGREGEGHRCREGRGRREVL